MIYNARSNTWRWTFIVLSFLLTLVSGLVPPESRTNVQIQPFKMLSATTLSATPKNKNSASKIVGYNDDAFGLVSIQLTTFFGPDA
jgi:hypothetical protein